MISPRTGAATLVQPPSAAGLPKSADLSVSTLDYDDRGHVTVSGLAAPGTVVRAYVNDKMVAEGVAASDGRWRLKPADPIEQGKHRAQARPHRPGRQAGRAPRDCRSSVSSWSRSPAATDGGCTS